MQLNNPLKKNLIKIYNYLFSYDPDKLSIWSLAERQKADRLEKALLERKFILIYDRKGKAEIGQLIKQISVSRYIFKSKDSQGKILKIIDLSDIFRVDLG